MFVEPDVEQSHLIVTYQRIIVVQIHAVEYGGSGGRCQHPGNGNGTAAGHLKTVITLAVKAAIDA
jgi:hypothetical protein